MYEHKGAHIFLPGGNLRLLEGLAQGLPVLYRARARLVEYCKTGVRAASCAACPRLPALRARGRRAPTGSGRPAGRSS